MATPTLATEEEDEEAAEADEQPEGGADEEPETMPEKPETDEEEEAETTEQTPDEEEEEVDVEEVEMPEDDDDVETEGGSLLSGTTFGISNKMLLGVGIAAILLLLILSNAESESTGQPVSPEEAEEKIDETTDGAVREDQAASINPDRQYDAEAEAAAVDGVFGQ